MRTGGSTSRCRGSPAADHTRGDPGEFVCNRRRLCCKRASFTLPYTDSLLRRVAGLLWNSPTRGNNDGTNQENV